MKETTKNGKKIYNWVISHHNPITWNIIAVKIGDYFLANNIDPFFIRDSTEFNIALVQKIDHLLKSQYNSSLPVNLY